MPAASCVVVAAVEMMAFATGPLTMGSGEVLCVDVCTASRLNFGSPIAFTHVNNTGMYSAARIRAITALAAIFSTVATPCLGASVAKIAANAGMAGCRRMRAGVVDMREGDRRSEVQPRCSADINT